MNFSPLPVVMLMVGIILIYSGVKDVDPRAVVKNALQGKPTTKTTGSGSVPPPPSGFDPGAGAGKGGGGGGGGSW